MSTADYGQVSATPSSSATNSWTFASEWGAYATANDGRVVLTATTPLDPTQIPVQPGSYTSPYSFVWYRSTTSGTTGSAISSASNSPLVLDTSVTNGTTYYYTCVATWSGNTHTFAQVSATPSASVSPSTNLGGGPNEPAGYAKILEWDMGYEFPPHGSGSSSWPGGSFYGGGNYSNASDHGQTTNIALVTDPSAPTSGPNVMLYQWPSGFGYLKPGLPPNFFCWDTSSPNATLHGSNFVDIYKEVYTKLTFRIWAELGHGVDDGKLHHALMNSGGVTMDFSVVDQGGARSDNIWTQYGYKTRISWTDNSGANQTDVYETALDVGTFDEWATVEHQFIENTLDASGNSNHDGVIRVWHNGTLVGEWTNVSFRSGNTDQHMGVWWDGQTFGAPTNGAQGYLYDHLYVSGVAA